MIKQEKNKSFWHVLGEEIQQVDLFDNVIFWKSGLIIKIKVTNFCLSTQLHVMRSNSKVAKTITSARSMAVGQSCWLSAVSRFIVLMRQTQTTLQLFCLVSTWWFAKTLATQNQKPDLCFWMQVLLSVKLCILRTKLYGRIRHRYKK